MNIDPEESDGNDVGLDLCLLYSKVFLLRICFLARDEPTWAFKDVPITNISVTKLLMPISIPMYVYSYC